MKFMTQSRAAVLALLCTGIAFAGREGWSEDFEAAKKEAVKSEKTLLIDVTGSDWCGYCVKLNEEVFKQDVFKTAAKDKFVLLELDYPQDKSKLSAEVLKQNEDLAKTYVIDEFPTILLTDGDGRPFALTGYKEGGAETYVKHLDELLTKRKSRDDGFAAAEKASGVEKAKLLISTLEAMGLNDALVANFYASTVESIKKSDPDDSTGYAKKMEAKARLTKFETEFNVLGEKQDFAGAMALVDKTIKDGGFEKEDTQRLVLTRALVFAEQGKFDEAIKVADEAKQIAPESEGAVQIDQLRKQLEAMKAHGGEGE